MNMVVLEKGDESVKIAVEDRICIVASRMKWDLPSSSGSSGFSGSSGSSDGSFGVERCGAGSVIGKLESNSPRAGCAGILSL